LEPMTYQTITVMHRLLHRTNTYITQINVPIAKQYVLGVMYNAK